MYKTTVNEDLSAYLYQACSYFALPTLSLGVIKEGCELLVFESGDKSLQPPLYKIGSLTKLITGIAILELKGEGLLDLEDRVSKYLPWFNREFHNVLSDEVTIMDLLLHTSGLPRGGLFKKNPSQAEVIASADFSEEPFPARSTGIFKYSNLGYIILGFIIETVTKDEYRSFVQQRIFDPLQMSESGFGINEMSAGITEPHSLSYFSGSNKSPYDFIKIPLLNAPHASFDMHSHLDDFSKLLACILNKGIHNGTRVLREDTIQGLFKNSRPINAQLNSTVGLMSINAFKGIAYFQNAEHWGHSASMLVMPGSKFALIAMTNRGSGGLELWTILQTIAKYFTQHQNADYLNYNYPGYLRMIGEYTAHSQDPLVISRQGARLYMSSGMEEPSRLVYKGRNSFLKLEGANSRYIISPHLEKGQVKGLCIGPYYYNKSGAETGVGHTNKYEIITGVYANNTVGRIALFERNGSLILAYSPLKEAVLEQREPGLFIQATGPFIDEPVNIDARSRELRTGALIFKKADNHTY